MARSSRAHIPRAQELRRDPTEAERALWAILRSKQLEGFRFRRQHPVPPYFLDFACPSARVAVEADGGHHGPADVRRDAYLAEQGWRVLRLWNDEILRNGAGCAESIRAALHAPPPQPSPRPTAEGREHEPRSKRGLPRAIAITRHGTPTDTITLDHTSRHRRRLRLTTDAGLDFLLDLPEPRHLHENDLLCCDDGRLIRVRAAPEPVADLRCRTPEDLARLAWHIGNRHAPAQLVGGALRIARDHVLIDMARRLGADIMELDAPFEPEAGAYAGGHHHGPG